MKYFKHILKHSLSHYVLSLLLFAVSWHVVSAYVHLKDRTNFIEKQLLSGADDIEKAIINNNMYKLSNHLLAFVSNVNPSIEFNSLISTPVMMKSFSVGRTSNDNFLDISKTIVIRFNGLELAEVRIVFDLKALNIIVLHNNSLLYLFIGVLFLMFIALVNYSSYKVFNSLEGSILEIEQNIDISNIPMTLQHLKQSLMQSSSSARRHELINLIDKIKLLLSKQLEMHDAAQKNKIITELSRRVAHDIRSPLSLLKVCAASPDKLAAHHEVVEAVVERMDSLADKLLSKTRNTSSVSEDHLIKKQEPTTTDFIVQSAIRQIFKEKVLEYSHSKIFFQLNVKIKKSTLVRGDLQQFKTIVSNLVNNSCEAFSAVDNYNFVKVEVDSLGDGVQVSVIDNGKGMERSLINKALILGGTKGKANGNGIALFQANTLVKQWGGQMLVNSKVHKGTKVRLLLRTSSLTGPLAESAVNEL